MMRTHYLILLILFRIKLFDCFKHIHKKDDYIDCYGDPEITGKIGTDIEESKCSWLVVQALKKANPEQLAMLEVNIFLNNEYLIS